MAAQGAKPVSEQISVTALIQPTKMANEMGRIEKAKDTMENISIREMASPAACIDNLRRELEQLFAGTQGRRRETIRIRVDGSKSLSPTAGEKKIVNHLSVSAV